MTLRYGISRLRPALICLLWLFPGCTGANHEPLPHRPTREACPASHDAPEPTGCDVGDECRSHSDCTEGENGHCQFLVSRNACGCTYDECTTDADCGWDDACVCARTSPYAENSYNHYCVHAECHVDTDCESGLCQATGTTCIDVYEPGIVTSNSGWYCASSSDSCDSHEDCDAPEVCTYVGGAFNCNLDYQVVCGGR